MTKLTMKWDPAKREYKDCEIPDESVTYVGLNEIIKCAQCGKRVLFGNCYVSRQIHTTMGFGYAVCEKCYEKEIREEESAMKENEEC